MRKKFLLLGMSVMMLFGASGCDGNVGDYPKPKSV